MGHPDEVDIIVCGGGPAGSVVAGRLAYADPSLKVMLIEAGANNRDDPWVYRPGIYVRNMQRDGMYGIQRQGKFYVDTMQSSYLRGRQSIVPYDFKTPGWTAKGEIGSLYLIGQDLENYQKPTNNDSHGYDGPIAISNGGTISALAQDFLRASDSVGIPFSDDLQDLNTSHASEIWAKYINRHTGRRSDAATAYVHSVMDVQTNLYLRTNSRVSRVIFEGTKAVGVAYVPAKNRFHAGQFKETIVRARKCVVVSSGTLGTPQILERSGVGSKSLMDKVGLTCVSDLPVFRVSNESQTLDDFLRGDKEAQRELFNEWEVSPEKARLSSNAIDAGFKIRPTEEELKEMGPEFNALWDTYFKDKPDKPLMFNSIVSGAYADHTLLPPGKYITIRGKIHISSPDPYTEPTFDSGFMNNKADFAPIRWSYKKTREIARRMDAYRGELTSHHPRFHPASPAAAQDIDIRTAKEMLPNSFTVGIHMGTWHKPGDAYDANKVHEDIKYTEEDDKASMTGSQVYHVETTWHSLAMKPREEGGVVDERLNVFGTQNLKCCDLSICPVCVGRRNQVLLVGEKGASLIAEELDQGSPCAVPHAPIPKGVPTTQQVVIECCRTCA
ncbi:methanol oxidase [Pholiota molesta]|nr:methanol oxidase [Pholiota molesta]